MKFKGLGGHVYLLFCVSLIMNIAIHTLNFSIVFFFRDGFQLSTSSIGIIYALGSVSYLLSCMFMGKIIKGLAARTSIMTAVLFMTTCLIVIRLSPWLAVTTLAYFVFNLSMGLLWPPLMGWLTEGLEGKSLGNLLGFFNVSWSSGALLGPLLAGFLVDLGMLLAFQVSIGLVFFVFLLIFLFSVIQNKKSKNLTLNANKTDISDLNVSLKDSPSIDLTEIEGEKIQFEEPELAPSGRETKLRYLSWGGIFSSYLLVGIVISIFPLFVRSLPACTAFTAGSMLFVRGIFTTITFLLLGMTESWHFNSRVILLVQLLMILVALGLVFNRSLMGYYLLMAVLGALFASAYAGSAFHGASGSKNRSSRMAIHEGVLTAGTLVGSSLSGFIYEYVSMKFVFVVAAVILSVILVGQVGFLFKKRIELKEEMV